jgi:hypothetical protein
MALLGPTAMTRGCPLAGIVRTSLGYRQKTDFDPNPPVLVAAAAARFTGCVDRAATERRARGATMQEGKSAAYTTGSR